MLEKRQLLDHREELVSTSIPKRQRLYMTSGGSTGVPVGFYLHRGISRPKEQAFLETLWKRGGYFDGARNGRLGDSLGLEKWNERGWHWDPLS